MESSRRNGCGAARPCIKYSAYDETGMRMARAAAAAAYRTRTIRAVGGAETVPRHMHALIAGGITAILDVAGLQGVVTLGCGLGELPGSFFPQWDNVLLSPIFLILEQLFNSFDSIKVLQDQKGHQQ